MTLESLNDRRSRDQVLEDILKGNLLHKPKILKVICSEGFIEANLHWLYPTMRFIPKGKKKPGLDNYLTRSVPH